MGIQQTLLGGGRSINEIFKTDLWTGNGSATDTTVTQTITNGIDLTSTDGGGLVWIKSRDITGHHMWFDTLRGTGSWIRADIKQTAPAVSSNTLTSFNANGYTLGHDNVYVNQNSEEYVGWTFRRAPGFFDVVEWSGSSSAQTISHNLGCVPGMMLITARGITSTQIYRWLWHRDETNTGYMFFDDGNQSTYNSWLTKPPTATDFTVPYDQHVNAPGPGTFTAYLWAHDEPSEYSRDGVSPVIKAGIYTANSTSPPSVNLGFEPQWLWIYKNENHGGRWVFDSTRGTDRYIRISNIVEGSNNHSDELVFTSTGFDIGTQDGQTPSSQNASYLNQPGTYLYLAVAAP